MAKKGQTVQLQTELNTDEEWEKYLQKPGLLVIDVYSDWCGPCAGMQANLKKIKVEIGGDTLQLAIAKSDGITALERFRGTSEPTWMLISGGKMVGFMYGANAPKLTQLITEELKTQKMVDESHFVRSKVIEVTERAPEEAERWERVRAILAEEEAMEEAKIAAEIHQRLLKESDAILENLGNLGVLVVLPHAKDKYLEVMKEVLNEAGLVISISEKIKIVPEQIEAISYFLEKGGELHLPEDSLEHMYTGESLVTVVKASHGTADMEIPVSVRVLEALYGASRTPPGEEGCPYQRLIKKIKVNPEENMEPKIETEMTSQEPSSLPHEISTDHTENEEKEPSVEEEMDFLIGIWAPPTRRILGSCFKIFFPRMAAPLLIPQPAPKPPFIAVCFPIDKRSKVQSMMSEWESEVERYGIFSSSIPEDAQLIAKSFKKFDKSDIDKTGNEKIVIQLARKRSECILAFSIEMPNYMSPNVKEGKRELKIFFPDGYDEPPAVEESEDVECLLDQEEASEYIDLEGMEDLEGEEEIMEEGSEYENFSVDEQSEEEMSEMTDPFDFMSTEPGDLDISEVKTPSEKENASEEAAPPKEE